MNALVVEGDRTIATQAVGDLSELGLGSVVARDGRTGLRKLLSGNFCLALVDTELPGISGIELIRRARACDDKTPIVILSAKNEVGDRVCGLNIGADDYLAKPFSPKELQARVNALLRRAGMELKRNRISFQDLELNVLERRALRGGRDLELTPREYEILEYMVRNANRTVSLGQILKEVWKCSAPPLTTIVETRLCLLRKKLRRNGRPDLIHTLRGFGYVLK